jgi:hypothetical protein
MRQPGLVKVQVVDVAVEHALDGLGVVEHAVVGRLREVSTRGLTLLGSTPGQQAGWPILAGWPRVNSLCGIGPMMPKWLRVGFKNTGMAPVMMMACKMDLWQLRSTTTTSPGATVWCHTILLEVLVPLVTKKQWSALKMRAALRSLAPPGRCGPAADPALPPRCRRRRAACFRQRTGGTSGPPGS